MDIRSSLEVSSSINAGQSNVFVVRLVLTFRIDEVRVASLVEAHLDESVGRFEPGSHVLYERRSDGLDVEEAMTAAKSHIDSLYGIEDYPVTLGLAT
ncbi:hypothetical protein [Micromonospora sp. WMMD812]|uniref:hypothetical protein n=1 Tax=Micromonospora sp. WMMD812 TaxID=3015152 RepID=UPI00248C40CE|nr:hypothetical protein [Micromonospora sp. WMMD812]WBB70629.1 hypothetical protein O7603_15285 [Micromonospora sp. WMMD812]